MNSFVDQINLFGIKVDKRTNAIVRKIVIDVSSSLIMKTPVGDPDYWQSPPPPGYVGGRARGNWQYGTDGINYNSNNAIDANGGNTLAVIVGKVPEDAASHSHYITNTLAYIEPLENGHSRQAPNGMIGLTVIEYKPIVEAVIKAMESE